MRSMMESEKISIGTYTLYRPYWKAFSPIDELYQLCPILKKYNITLKLMPAIESNNPTPSVHWIAHTKTIHLMNSEKMPIPLSYYLMLIWHELAHIVMAKSIDDIKKTDFNLNFNPYVDAMKMHPIARHNEAKVFAVQKLLMDKYALDQINNGKESFELVSEIERYTYSVQHTALTLGHKSNAITSILSSYNSQLYYDILEERLAQL